MLENKLVYPWIPPSQLEREWQDLRAKTPGKVEAALKGQILTPDLQMPATGGRPPEEKKLMALRRALTEAARKAGFPARIAGDREKQKFDLETARILHSRMNIIPSQADRPGVWPFICLRIVPHLVLWRWKRAKGEDVVKARFADGPRNALGRLWWRAHLGFLEMPEDPYFLLDMQAGGLQEDRWVGILERPSIASAPGMTRILAFELLRRRNGRVLPSGKTVSEEAIFRDVLTRIHRWGAFISLEALETAEMEDLVVRAFDESYQVHGLPLLKTAERTLPANLAMYD